MSSPGIQRAAVSYHKVNMWIELENEAAHLVNVAWWLEEMQFKIKLCKFHPEGMFSHMAVFNPMIHQDLAKNKIRKLLGVPDSTELDDHLLWIASIYLSGIAAERGMIISREIFGI